MLIPLGGRAGGNTSGNTFYHHAATGTSTWDRAAAEGQPWREQLHCHASDDVAGWYSFARCQWFGRAIQARGFPNNHNHNNIISSSLPLSGSSRAGTAERR